MKCLSCMITHVVKQKTCLSPKLGVVGGKSCQPLSGEEDKQAACLRHGQYYTNTPVNEENQAGFSRGKAQVQHRSRS